MPGGEMEVGMETMEDLFRRFERLNAIGAALSNERDLDRLLENILLAAKSITHADGGTLYRVSQDKRSLRFAIVRTDTLGIAYGGTSGAPLLVPDGAGGWLAAGVQVGAHAAGHNAGSLGICLVGTDRYTRQQWLHLELPFISWGQNLL